MNEIAISKKLVICLVDRSVVEPRVENRIVTAYAFNLRYYTVVTHDSLYCGTSDNPKLKLPDKMRSR